MSQAQNAVRDLVAALEKRGTEVKCAIHPVAGRMPGHTNVLLAEANVPYDSLFDLDMINADFARTDAALVVGANDVVNPGTKTDTASPIYGMPVFNVEQARSVIVLKRSTNTCFSGAENELSFLSNTMMVPGDAKKTILGLREPGEGRRVALGRALAGELVDERDVLRHRVVRARALLLAPCVELRAALEVEHAGARAGPVTRGRLLVERVELEEVVVRRRLRELLRASLRILEPGGEIGHASRVARGSRRAELYAFTKCGRVGLIHSRGRFV